MTIIPSHYEVFYQEITQEVIMAKEKIQNYYTAFNTGNDEALLALLHPEVIHDINQGGREIGKEKFATFMKHMRKCYKETVEELVIFCNDSGTRGSAEFMVRGEYIQTDQPLPKAVGQAYTLKVGAFFSFEEGLIKRVTTYYNLNEWIKLIYAQ